MARWGVVACWLIPSECRGTSTRAIIARMAEPASPRPLVRLISPLKAAAPADAEKMICERCGVAEMYRMHAVWRCPACGFKTDCCGW